MSNRFWLIAGGLIVSVAILSFLSTSQQINPFVFVFQKFGMAKSSSREDRVKELLDYRQIAKMNTQLQTLHQAVLDNQVKLTLNYSKAQQNLAELIRTVIRDQYKHNQTQLSQMSDQLQEISYSSEDQLNLLDQFDQSLATLNEQMDAQLGVLLDRFGSFTKLHMTDHLVRLQNLNKERMFVRKQFERERDNFKAQQAQFVQQLNSVMTGIATNSENRTVDLQRLDNPEQLIFAHKELLRMNESIVDELRSAFVEISELKDFELTTGDPRQGPLGVLKILLPETATDKLVAQMENSHEQLLAIEVAQKKVLIPQDLSLLNQKQADLLRSQRAMIDQVEAQENKLGVINDGVYEEVRVISESITISDEEPLGIAIAKYNALAAEQKRLMTQKQISDERAHMLLVNQALAQTQANAFASYAKEYSQSDLQHLIEQQSALDDMRYKIDHNSQQLIQLDQMSQDIEEKVAVLNGSVAQNTNAQLLALASNMEAMDMHVSDVLSTQLDQQAMISQQMQQMSSQLQAVEAMMADSDSTDTQAVLAQVQRLKALQKSQLQAMKQEAMSLNEQRRIAKDRIDFLRSVLSMAKEDQDIQMQERKDQLELQRDFIKDNSKLLKENAKMQNEMQKERMKMQREMMSVK